jgi:hypothetical protein
MFGGSWPPATYSLYNDFITTTVAEPIHSLPSWIPDPLTFASSQNEESDFAAKRRWESEGGNPGQLQQALCDDRKEDATTGPTRGTLKAFRYEV